MRITRSVPQKFQVRSGANGGVNKGETASRFKGDAKVLGMVASLGEVWRDKGTFGT
jgi:hypothetical protein